ncbi:MAG TPA: hypothetical protein VM328_01420, partial [Fimbriimonadaceae bacterium]|nr:hypothetical protein [Fimbriimonadaceae bacterium]
MRRVPILVGLLLFALLLPILLLGVLVGAGNELAPSDQALAEIPEGLIPIYEAAARSCEGLDWT